MASGARIALMTAPDAATAERIVRTLVEERVVACGNIVPGLTSIYRWQGSIERETEVLVILKTMADSVDRLASRIPELHPYDVPEVLVLPIEAGHKPYIEWLEECTG